MIFILCAGCTVEVFMLLSRELDKLNIHTEIKTNNSTKVFVLTDKQTKKKNSGFVKPLCVWNWIVVINDNNISCNAPVGCWGHEIRTRDQKTEPSLAKALRIDMPIHKFQAPSSRIVCPNGLCIWRGERKALHYSPHGFGTRSGGYTKLQLNRYSPSQGFDAQNITTLNSRVIDFLLPF